MPRSCYKCEGGLRPASLAKCRLCDSCGTRAVVCSFCNRTGNAKDRWCNYAENCKRQVVICDSCAALHKAVVCGKCWSKDWKSRCFKCREKGEQHSSGCGRFCARCHHAVFDLENEKNLAVESFLHATRCGRLRFDEAAVCFEGMKIDHVLDSQFFDWVAKKFPKLSIHCARLRRTLAKQPSTILDATLLDDIAPYFSVWNDQRLIV